MAAVDTEGQRHDRIGSQPDGDRIEMQPLPKLGPAATLTQPDTSIVQKMLSATTGSVLTSLLGRRYQTRFRKKKDVANR